MSGDGVKKDIVTTPENANEQKKRVYIAAVELINRFENRFVVFSEKKLDSTNVTVSGICQTREGEYYDIDLTLVRSKDENKDLLEQVHIESLSSRRTIYRLDVKSGPETNIFYSKFVEGQKDENISLESRQQFPDYLKFKFIEVNGIVMDFNSGAAETSISENDAEKIINSIVSVDIPLNRSRLPTWKHFKLGNRKLFPKFIH